MLLLGFVIGMRKNILNVMCQSFLLRHWYIVIHHYERSVGLYLNKYRKSDHLHISEVIQNDLALPWVVSYDGAKEIIKYYESRNKFLYELQYNASRVYKGVEVFIFSDQTKKPTSSKLSYIDKPVKKFWAAPQINFVPQALLR